MEILVYEGNIEEDYQTVMVVDWKEFDSKVRERPEDYIFVLSPDEMTRFMELNKQIRVGLRGEGMTINEAEYANRYQGVFVIAALAVHPDFVQRYKLGHFTHTVLGSSHAVFYVNRATSDMERANAVLRRIIDLKRSLSGEDSKGNSVREN